MKKQQLPDLKDAVPTHAGPHPTKKCVRQETSPTIVRETYDDGTVRVFRPNSKKVW